ncbi:hypothetical protein H0X48_03800 [Candidatus Dependentiae bacterium]|nr:hypothetical protein [Candidatus Dependentiae bacterium]
MKQSNRVLLFLILIASTHIKADALENAIKESKLNEFIEFFNNSVVARTLKQQDAKRYAELAQEVLGERSSYLLRRFDIYDITRMATGFMLGALGFEGFQVGVNSCNDKNGAKINVSTVHHAALASLGLVTFLLGADQLRKGYFKDDRYEKYKNSLAIHTILQSTQPNHCQLETE